MYELQSNPVLEFFYTPNDTWSHFVKGNWVVKAKTRGKHGVVQRLYIPLNTL